MVHERLRLGRVPVLAKLGGNPHRAPLPGGQPVQEAPQPFFTDAVRGCRIEIAHAQRKGSLQQRERLPFVRDFRVGESPGLADTDQTEAEFHPLCRRRSHRWLRYHSSVIRMPSSNE